MDIIEKYRVLLLVCSCGSPYGIKEHKNDLWRLQVFVHNIIGTLWCYRWTLSNILDIILVKKQFSGKSQFFYGSPYGIKEHKNDCFVHNIIETRVTHKTCTVHLTRHFRLSNATILHHRVQVWWTIQDIL